MAAVRALGACRDEFAPVYAARLVAPKLVPLALDPAKPVRDAAVPCLEAYLAVVRKAAEEMTRQEEIRAKQEAAKRQFVGPVPRVKGRVRAMQGGFSGGTAASLKATMAAAAKDPGVLDLLRSPFALAPGFDGPPQPHGMKPEEDPDLGAWVAPFVMAPINTKNVHRSNFLMGHPYGRDFVYDEMMIAGPGERGAAVAKAMADAGASMGGDGGPKPGEGPSKEEREAGFYDVLFLGLAADGRQIRVGVKGDRDPGYGSTSKMLAEAAICLVKEAPEVPGGIWTPGAALGHRLVERLTRNAGLSFEVEAA